MNDSLERRLRDHLAAVEATRVPTASAVRVTADRRRARAQRRTRAVVGALCVCMALVATAGVWLAARGRDDGAAADPAGTLAPIVPNSTEPTPATTSPDSLPETGPATDESWRSIPPDPRGNATNPSVVWTGTEALVTAGADTNGQGVPGASAYDPATDTWRSLADPPANSGRTDALTVWTGTEMLVLGGDLPNGDLLVSSGLAYDPATDTWRTTASPTGFVNRRSPSAWTGTQLLVWPWNAGGSTMRTTPIAYDPATDSWRELAEPPIERRQEAASVWTGSEWIVWGGADDSDGHVEYSDGAAYDPVTDTWRQIAPSPLSPRIAPGAWTGAELVIMAGRSGATSTFAHSDGAAYDPATDTWRSTKPGLAHPGFEPLLAGDLILMFAKGGVVVYDPAGDRWIDAGFSLRDATGTAVWTGTEALVIGSYEPEDGGVAFTPTTANS